MLTGIAADQEKVLNPVFAGESCSRGCSTAAGMATGRALPSTLPAHRGPEDLKNVRRTVNITDHWEEIASFYRQFMAAIDAARRCSA